MARRIAQAYNGAMPAANRIRPTDIFSPAEWADLSRRQPWRGPALVAHAWGLIAAAVTLVALWPNPLTVVLAIMIIGARQLGLAILMHEAAHGALHPVRGINDALGHWLCAAPVGAELASYRAYHLAHHKYVQEPEDPDGILAAPFPVRRASLRRKIIRDLTGQTFFGQRILGLFANSADAGTKTDNAAQAQADVLSGRRALTDFLLTNGALLGLSILAGLWWAYLLWLVALATWFPFVTRIRNIAEHACVERTDDPLGHARTTLASWWERLLIAPYWVHYHSEHHTFMHLPCYRLPAAHRLMQAKGYGARLPTARSYAEVLRTAAPRRPA